MLTQVLFSARMWYDPSCAVTLCPQIATVLGEMNPTVLLTLVSVLSSIGTSICTYMQ